MRKITLIHHFALILNQCQTWTWIHRKNKVRTICHSYEATDSSKAMMVFLNSISSLFHKQQWVKRQPSLQTQGKAKMFQGMHKRMIFIISHRTLFFLLMKWRCKFWEKLMGFSPQQLITRNILVRYIYKNFMFLK